MSLVYYELCDFLAPICQCWLLGVVSNLTGVELTMCRGELVVSEKFGVQELYGALIVSLNAKL